MTATATHVKSWGVTPQWPHFRNPHHDDLVEIDLEGQTFTLQRLNALRLAEAIRDTVGVTTVLS